MLIAIAVLWGQLMAAALGERVHYTNSQLHLAQNSKDFSTYKLDIPGSSDSITIIEAVNNNHHDDNDGEGDRDDDAAAAPIDGDSNSQKTVYAPTLLTKYISEYNRKYQSDDGDEDVAPADSQDRAYYPKRDESYHLYTEEGKQHQYRPQFSAGPPRDAVKGTFKDTFKDGFKKNDFKDSQGWVTLEAVPWSKSKVSIWKPNVAFHKQSQSQLADELSGVFSHQAPVRYGQSQNSNNNNGYLTRYTSDEDEPVVIQPSTKQPIIVTGSPNDRFFDYRFDDNKPAAEDFLGVENDPSDFLETGYHAAQQSIHPDSYPDSGKGEWVLVSTTKGYNQNRLKSPGSRKVFDNPQNESASSYRVHKSLKLTVLPPRDNTQQMVLSHGGLIEIASSTPANTTNRVNNVLNPIKAATATGKKPNGSLAAGRKKSAKKNAMRLVRGIKVNNQKVAHHDKAAVLAAVGAGMVPAGMAMIMPFLGKRK